MCVALPMLVEAVDGYSLTVSRAGETKVVNAALIGDDVKPGDMVMVFIDQAIRRITPEEAAEVDSALGALGTVLAGEATEETIRAGFGDILDGPKLPPHLQAQVGKKTL